MRLCVTIAVCLLAIGVQGQGLRIKAIVGDATYEKTNKTQFLPVNVCPGCNAQCDGCVRPTTRGGCYCAPEDPSHNGITIHGYEIVAPEFPCRAGQSTQTIFDMIAHGSYTDNVECDVTCTGAGCMPGKVNMCHNIGDTYIGVPCPVHAENEFKAAGPVTACTNGLGSYAITITCPNILRVHTYIRY